MSRPSLIKAFKSIPGVPLRGSLFRAIPLRYISTPLSAAGALARGGRYNPATAFEAFYFAYSPDTTLYELRVIAPKTAPTRTKPLITFTIDVALQATVDLTNPANLSALRSNPTTCSSNGKRSSSPATFRSRMTSVMLHATQTSKRSSYRPHENAALRIS